MSTHALSPILRREAEMVEDGWLCADGKALGSAGVRCRALLVRLFEQLTRLEQRGL